MSFAATDPGLARIGKRLVAAALADRGHGTLAADRLSLCMVLPGLGQHPRGRPRGFAHRADVPVYPASVVKLFYLVAAHALLEQGRLQPSAELDLALAAMIRTSSNDATGYVVDRLTGTTGGPELAPAALARWLARRRAINRYFATWGWPELAACTMTQKTWDDAPYGREQQSRLVPGSRNALTAAATARLLLGIDRGEVISRARCAAIRRLLARRPDAGEPEENQAKGFLGEGLPAGSRLWSKAGWMSQVRHDAAIIALPRGPRLVLVVFTEGAAAAADTRRLPAIAAEAARLLAGEG